MSFPVFVALLFGSIAIALSGCWYAAVQFAPAGLSIAQNLGSSIASLTGDKSVPALGVVELRMGAGGEREYRDLQVDKDGLWVPIVDSDSDAQGWRPAVNFTRMSFDPPLDGAFPSTGSRILAYMPASESSDAQERLAAFTKYFGAPIGSFKWEGQIYQYSMPPALPQFRKTQ